MVETKIDYLRKPWLMPFPKIPFLSKLDLYCKHQPWFSQIQQKSANFGRFPPKITIVRSKCFFELTEQ